MYKLLLSCFLIVGSVFGASLSDLTYTISNFEVQITDCDTAASGQLVIPEYIEGLPVTSIGNEAFYQCSSLTSVTIPSSVTSIGGYAFHDCSSLTSIAIPWRVTSIGDYAFAYCSSLTSITIHEGVTRIGVRVFRNCSSLTSITLPSSVTSIGGYAFYDCSSLTSITIPEGVTSIGLQAFARCSGLTSIVFKGPAAPTLGSNVFLDVASTATITYPFGATGYSNPFGGLPATESSPLSYLITGGQVQITDCDTSVTGALEIPATIEGAPVTSIGDEAFAYCSSLTSITIPEGVTSIGTDAFKECISLTSITLPSTVTSIVSGAFINCYSLTSITLPSGVTSLGSYAFFNCTSLTSIVFKGPAAPTLGVDVFYNVAYGATITYPFGATGYSNPFGGLPATESSPLSYVITDGQVQITDCDTSVTGALEIPATIEGAPVTSIGDGAFYQCSSLTSITIPEGVTSIGSNAFRGCSSLTSITLPSGVTSIGGYAFSSCYSLTSITLPSSMTSLGTHAFAYCYSLTSITIPSSVNSIESGTFYNCSSLTSITIPSSVTSIESGTFGGCTSLTSITIPDSVTSIVDYAFYNCSSLTSIVFEGPTAPTLGSDVFLNVASGATITYPFGATGYSNPFGGLPASPTAAPAEISVGYNGTNIVDGDSSPSTGEGTAFGSQDFSSGSVVRTFRVSNTGESSLSLGAASSSSGEFTVSGLASSISGGSFDDFTVTFDPGSVGTKTATISFSTNDSDENPFNFTVSGVGTEVIVLPAEISVGYNDTNIVDGDSSPSTGEGTAFGSQDFSSGSVVRTFRVSNTGESSLSLGAASSSSGEFTVSGLASSISGGSFDDFTVTFDPGSVGTKTATISFSTNDSDENPFNFTVSGVGTEVIVLPAEISVGYNDTNIVDGDSSPSTGEGTAFGSQDFSSGSVVRTFRVSNTGESSLSLGAANSSSGEFTVSGLVSSISGGSFDDFTVTFDPGSVGTKTATISFSTNDSDENPFNFTVSGVGTEVIVLPAEISVGYNDTNIVDGDSSPSTGEGTAFGSQDFSSGSVVRTFRVSNTGESSLSLGAASSSSGEFSVSGLASSISGGSFGDFTVTFDPGSVGTKTATISFSTNDSDENPFNFDVSGVGTEVDVLPPEISVGYNGTNIVDGDSSPSTGEGTAFGSQDFSSGSVVRTFRVSNTGESSLSLGAVSSSSGEFTVSGLASSISGGSFDDFTVTFDPGSVGTKTATISFSTNDSDENPFNFTVSGVGTEVVVLPPAEISVGYNGTNIVDGDSSPSTGEGTAFGSQDFSSGSVVRTFRVSNTGESSLSLGAASSSSGEFTVSGLASSISGGSFDDFTVTFDPGSVGTKTATISFSTNDSDENPFNFEVSGVGTEEPNSDPDGWLGGAADLGSGWIWLDWLGSINVVNEPWIYHFEHGWLYSFSVSRPESVFLWDNGMQSVIWTSETVYPAIYRFSDRKWIYYSLESRSPRWFVDLITGDWEQW